jgi:hypothetical protein
VDVVVVMRIQEDHPRIKMDVQIGHFADIRQVAKIRL